MRQDQLFTSFLTVLLLLLSRIEKSRVPELFDLKPLLVGAQTTSKWQGRVWRYVLYFSWWDLIWLLFLWKSCCHWLFSHDDFEVYFAWNLSDLNIPPKDDFAFYFAWKSRIEEEDEKEKGAGNGNEQDTVSPDMMILKMDLMVMISKMATVHRKEETVSRDVRILSMILDLMVMTIKMATQWEQSRKDNIVKSSEILNMDMMMHENRRWR